jgi:NAD(P)-dependent dehydrogenase (short-subunit alcohol dehydrogenase family)
MIIRFIFDIIFVNLMDNKLDANEIQKNRWILVTGASSGIGRAIVDHLCSHGFCVYASARALNRIQNVVALKFDVTKPGEIQDAYNFVKEKGTGLYAIVNNAGIAVPGPLMDISDEEFQEQFDISVMGTHRVTRIFFPLLYESKGRVVMISSDSGFFATPFFGAYCSSKFAIEGYSDSLRRELMFVGMKVIIIEPGRISTPIWNKGRKYIEKYPNSLWVKYIKELGEYVINKGNTEGLPPKKVAELVETILLSENPKTRYLIAPKTFKYKLIRKVLSDKYIDNMLYKELK